MVRSYEVSFAKSRRAYSWPLGIEVTWEKPSIVVWRVSKMSLVDPLKRQLDHQKRVYRSVGLVYLLPLFLYPLPPHSRLSRNTWRLGLEPRSCTLCCVCDVGSACDRVLPFCLTVAPPSSLQTPLLSCALRYCLKTPSPRKSKYEKFPSPK